MTLGETPPPPKIYVSSGSEKDMSLTIHSKSKLNIADCTDQCSVPAEVLSNPSVDQQEILLFEREEYVQ
jgi:hypothetical protein